MTYPLPTGFTSRSATTEGAFRIAALWNDRSQATRGERPSTAERVLKTWDHPKLNLSADSRLVISTEGSLIGHTHIRDIKNPPVDVFGG